MTDEAGSADGASESSGADNSGASEADAAENTSSAMSDNSSARGEEARDAMQDAGGVLDDAASHVGDSDNDNNPPSGHSDNSDNSDDTDGDDDPQTANVNAAPNAVGDDGTPEDEDEDDAVADDALAAFDPTPPEDSWQQSLKETAIEFAAEKMGQVQAAAGWAGDMIGGAAAVVETAWEAGVTAVEAMTGIVPDEYAAKQKADLTARAEGMMAAAEQVMDDPIAVAEAFADSYEARFEAADALEQAYRDGHADTSALFEAERMRSEANTELGILGVETAATFVAGAGAIAKGLRAARVADKLDNATPLAMAMAATRQAEDVTQAVADLRTQPARDRQFTANDVTDRIDTELARRTPGTANGTGQTVGDTWMRDGVRTGDGAAMPEQIADRMRGKDFDSFQDFRETFWTEVAADPDLAQQFGNANRALMQQGYAPRVPNAEAVGGRVKFELDHIERLIDGGGVYDLDNIRVMTPRAHIERHRND